MPQVLTSLVYFSMLHKSRGALNVYTRVLKLAAELLFVVVYISDVNRVMSDKFCKARKSSQYIKMFMYFIWSLLYGLKTEL